MNRIPRWLLMLGVTIIAALFAFPLRDAVYDTVVVPVAFVGFQLGLFYRSLSQAIWWWVIIVIVLFMLAYSLTPKLKPTRRNKDRSSPRRGQVEELAVWLGRARGGVYFKWLVANRLGKLAYQILLHRESGRARSVFAPLVGADWEPSRDLQAYLETGLHGSFSDFPTPRRLLAVPPKTPLDHDVRDAVQFLESQVEGNSR
jgi:uncharacterized membrane protein